MEVPRLEIEVPQSVVVSGIATAFQSLGYTVASEEQHMVLIEFVSGKDVFVVLPTGSGKSLCFVSIPLVFEHIQSQFSSFACMKLSSPIVIVMSPLISLMKDQVSKYGGKGVTCAFIGDELDANQEKQILNGEFHIVYCSPESLLTITKWRDMLTSDVYCNNLVGLIVDEVHCVHSWGTDFRTEYANIAKLRSIVCKNVNMMALTATVTSQTRKTIMESLCMDEESTFVLARAPNKPNIRHSVETKPPKMDQMIVRLVPSIKQDGIRSPKTIIFCRTHKEFTEVSSSLVYQLHENGLFYVDSGDGPNTPICEMYSASTDEAVKDKILSSFVNPNGAVRIVVATIAFGMGLDAPNVSTIVHWGPSESIEAYIQETGRAGRNGLPASAILYYNKRDIAKNSKITDEMRLYCENTCCCRRNLLMKGFTKDDVECPQPSHLCCDVCQLQCSCDNCNSGMELTEEEIVTLADDFHAPTKKVIASTVRQAEVKQMLTNYRDKLCCVTPANPIPLFFGKEIVSGITDSLISLVARDCNNITSVEDLLNLGILSESHAKEILKMLNNMN